MPTMYVELYDDSQRTQVSTVSVVCTESEARFLENQLKHKRFLAHRHASGLSRNMTFKQFRQQFIEDETSAGGDFWDRQDE